MAPNGPPTVAQRLAALDALPDDAAREPAILRALEDESPAVRERAIRLAARYVEPGVLGAMVADGADAVRRNAALAALECQGPYALPYLQAMLSLADEDVVMFALQILARIGDPAAAPAVLPLIRHPQLNIAQSAIEALGRLRSRDAVPELLTLLGGEIWLQLAAIDALGAIGDPVAVGPLIELIPDSIMAEPAVLALQRLADPGSLGPMLARFRLVRERNLQDALLLAIGVVLDLHGDSAPITRAWGEELRLDPAGAVASYLRLVLAAPASGDDLDAEERFRAAAALVARADIAPLVPVLLARLGGPDAPHWAEAVFRPRPETLRVSLDQHLADADPRVRRGALVALVPEPEDAARLLPLLDDAVVEVRAAACRALALTGSPEASGRLIPLLRTGSPAERAAAVDGLARGPEELLPALAACLAPGTSEDEMIAALGVLGVRAYPPLEERILELATSRSMPLRRAALRAAARVPGSRAEVTLLRALADRNQPVQLEALELLVRRGGERTAVTLMALLGTGDSLRYHVIRALGHLQAADAVGRLHRLYPTSPLHERLEIIEALTRIGGPELPDFLRGRLMEEDVEIRRLAARGLADLADPADVGTFRRLARDPDWGIRNEAARGLAWCGAGDGREALLTLARDVEPVVARTARQSLDQLAGRSEPARQVRRTA
jgi:HEAT repeat protein